MDKNVRDQYVEELRAFLLTNAFAFATQEYNRSVISKLTTLQNTGMKDSLSLMNIESGKIAGFKEGFEFLEKLTRKE